MRIYPQYQENADRIMLIKKITFRHLTLFQDIFIFYPSPYYLKNLLINLFQNAVVSIVLSFLSGKGVQGSNTDK